MKICEKRRKSICFISETSRVERPLLDPSVRYRCYHPAEMLSLAGHSCTISSAVKFYENPNLDHDVYVFHRPNNTRPNMRKVIRILRENGARLIADYDDLIFGPEEIALISSAAKNGTLTEEQAITAFSVNLGSLKEFDMVTVSTEPLAAKVREFNPTACVAVVPNIIPDSILTIHSEFRTHQRPRPPQSIGYFAGTKSHDRDFPVVEAALHRVLSENPDFRLLVVGPVNVPRSIASLPNVATAPVVNYMRLPKLMSLCSTVIAPLEDSTFNNCKSRVKFLEAALTGCRLVASPISDMRVIGPDHITLAADLDDWYEALSHLPSAAERREMADRNFAFISQERSITGLVTFGELQ